MKHKNPKWNLEGIVITFKQQSHVISSYILSHQIKYFNIQSRIEYAIPFFQFLYQFKDYFCIQGANCLTTNHPIEALKIPTQRAILN